MPRDNPLALSRRTTIFLIVVCCLANQFGCHPNSKVDQINRGVSDMNEHAENVHDQAQPNQK